MPRPPILPTIDWKEIYESGRTYKTWLDEAEMKNHQEQMITNYEKTAVFDHEKALLNSLSKSVYVVVIAEDWCGDVVRQVPSLEKLIEGTDKVQSRYITREQHKDVFVRYLTNGGEAIPKIIFLSSDYVETGSWGPMPSAERRLISMGKGAGDVSSARKIVSANYKADPGNRGAVEEFIDLISIAAAPEIIPPAE